MKTLFERYLCELDYIDIGHNIPHNRAGTISLWVYYPGADDIEVVTPEKHRPVHGEYFKWGYILHGRIDHVKKEISMVNFKGFKEDSDYVGSILETDYPEYNIREWR